MITNQFDYKDFVIGLLEHSARLKGIERYQVYDYNEFFCSCKKLRYTRKKAFLEMVPGNSILTRKKATTELPIEYLLRNKQIDK